MLGERGPEPFPLQVGIAVIPETGVAAGSGFKIVRGDAADYADVAETVKDVDWVLNAMACISPAADYAPDMAATVNIEAVKSIVRALEAQPDGAERIRLIHTGTVAETGDRLGNIHRGRVGDPLKPSVFDYYAVTKIAGERAVLESNIRHWASLRMTFIMPTTCKTAFALRDPIAFHMPLNSFMENITDRDAAYGLVNCLDIPDHSDFWRRAYNMGGGPGMRCTAFELINRSYQLLGLSGIEACSDRKWYALRNFHMQYFEDSHVLNEYLHFWRDSLTDYWMVLNRDLPASIRLLTFLCRNIPALRSLVEQRVRKANRDMVENHRNGTVYWFNHGNALRIKAFYKDSAAYESIPDWGAPMPQLDSEPPWQRLNHGYDEDRQKLALTDLQGAARHRGGVCLACDWDGNMYTTLNWKCAFDHDFTAKPYTILKAGHWCPACLPPPWDDAAQARENPFFAQVWFANHDPDENEFYPEHGTQDIVGADRNPLNQGKKTK